MRISYLFTKIYIKSLTSLNGVALNLGDLNSPSSLKCCGILGVYLQGKACASGVHVHIYWKIVIFRILWSRQTGEKILLILLVQFVLEVYSLYNIDKYKFSTRNSSIYILMNKCLIMHNYYSSHAVLIMFLTWYK